MSYIYVAIAAAVVGFIIGALVFRNNAAAANKAIATAQTDASKAESTVSSVASTVSNAANTVAADVKKA
jgi:hypothetical protein